MPNVRADWYRHVVRLSERVFGGSDSLGNALAPIRRANAINTDPVVLVPGFGCTPASMRSYAESLRRDGFDVHVAEMPRAGLADLREQALVLRDFVDGVRRSSGHRKVDIVALSSGGIVARVMTELQGGADAVDSVVQLAAPNRGSTTARVVNAMRAVPLLGSVIPESVAQLVPSSSLIRELDAARAAARDVRYTSIGASHFDGFVSPASASGLEGSRVVRIRDKSQLLGVSINPNHYWLAHFDGTAYEAAREALLAPRAGWALLLPRG